MILHILEQCHSSEQVKSILVELETYNKILNVILTEI